MFTNYDFSFGAQQQDFELVINSGITDYNLKYDISYYPNSRHNFKTGVNYIFHTFVPTSVSAKQGSTVFDLGKKIKLYSHDAAIYVSDDWELTQKFKLNLGLRFSNFTQIGPFTRYLKDDFGKIYDTVSYKNSEVVANYNGLEPRFSARYSLTKTSSLKASYSRNFQYIHLASISSISLPTDIWMPSTEVIKPQESHQYALGIFKNFKDNSYETSIEVYYKTMNNMIEYKEGSQPTDNVYDNPDNAFTYGKGWAYGAEFFLKKVKENLPAGLVTRFRGPGVSLMTLIMALNFLPNTIAGMMLRWYSCTTQIKNGISEWYGCTDRVTAVPCPMDFYL